jgi:hypothetical protein
MTKKKDEGGTARWFGDKGMIRKNFDLGEGPYNGTPGAGEKSMGDFIKKRRGKVKKVLKEHGKVVATYVSDINKLALEFYNRVINGKENS